MECGAEQGEGIHPASRIQCRSVQKSLHIPAHGLVPQSPVAAHTAHTALAAPVDSNSPLDGSLENRGIVPKPVPTHAKHCPRCGHPVDEQSAPGYCGAHHAGWQQHRRGAVAWARWALVTRNVVVLDTETTGLDAQAEVLEIALLSTHGEVLFDSLIRPQGPIPVAATAVHQLDAATVAHAPTFREQYPRLAALLRKRFVLVYNAAFDRRILDQTCAVRPACPPSGRLALRHARVREVHWCLECREAGLHLAQAPRRRPLGTR